MKQQKRKNSIVVIFAHPDDEAFGPSGTIYKLALKNDVYLLCATKGEAGKGNQEKLGQTRSRELLESAKILGIKKVFFLGFIDGTLSNSLYHKLAEKIEKKLLQIKPSTIITYEPRGISGHIDHITVSMVSSYVFERLPFIKKIMYYCIDEKSQQRLGGGYFIYFPPGYKKRDIDVTFDISDVWKTKIEAMMAHNSQKDDAQRILKRRKNLPKKEYFLIKNK